MYSVQCFQVWTLKVKFLSGELLDCLYSFIAPVFADSTSSVSLPFVTTGLSDATVIYRDQNPFQVSLGEAFILNVRKL